MATNDGRHSGYDKPVRETGRGKPVANLMVGHTYAYGDEDGRGFGHMARGSELTAEMKELDLPDGAEVVLFALDEDSGWPIINWTDSKGIDRMTTVDPDIFNEHFQEA